MANRRFIRCVGLFCWAMFIGSTSAHASQLEINIKGTRYQSVSVDKILDGQAPSFWDIPQSLPVAEFVIPGGPSNVGAQLVNVSLGGTSVKLPITVKGMIYKLSSNVGSADNASGAAVSQVFGDSVLVTGSNAGNKIIELDRLENPITHFRPYLSEINESEWIDAFKNAKAKKGRYQGSIPIIAFYDYIRDGIRIRYTLTFSLSVVVNYAPQFLFDVVVEGNNRMEVKYHYPLKVSGETTYEITAKGFFTNGVWIGLVDPEGSYFSLKNASGDKEIKYSVICMTGCDGERIFIDEGKKNIGFMNNRSSMIGSNTERATATLKVSFNPVAEPEFRGETYFGKFILMFEARI